MKRSLTIRNILEKKPGRIIELNDPELKACIGNAERTGCWLIVGKEKNGKTSLALWLAKELSKTERVAYISAEEGSKESFKMAIMRAGLTAADKVRVDEYLSLEEIVKKFKKQKSADIIFIDNLTVYKNSISEKVIKDGLIDLFPKKLFVFLAHEERKEPSPANAKLVSKFASVIFHVIGLKAIVVSRYGNGGGELTIEETGKNLYWGDTNN